MVLVVGEVKRLGQHVEVAGLDAGHRPHELFETVTLRARSGPR
jgi:hypothetical protein